MAVIKTVRKAAVFAGKALDQEDRQFLARALVLLLGFGSVVVGSAAIVGLAWRVFGLAAG